jgi:hypothetical protein
VRVSSDIAQLDIAPGNQADVTLNIVNTGTVIDGVTARVVGLPDRNVSTSPTVLPLFPDSAGQLTVTLGLPQSFPAGRHPMTVEVLSRQPDIRPTYVNVDLVVPQAPAISVTTRPEVVRARRTARFMVTVTNRGNVTLDVDLTVNDPQKICGVKVQPQIMTLLPGAAVESVVTVRVPRAIMGTDFDRPLLVEAVARPAGTQALLPAPQPVIDPTIPGPVPDAAGQEVPAEPPTEPLTQQITITFRHRPYFTRGLMTALILLAIIALWAAAFLFGLARVFAGDPLTKSAPASFFAATQTDAQAGSGNGTRATAGTPTGGSSPTSGAGTTGTAAPGAGSGSGQGGSPVVAPAANAPPAGALPKGGALPAGVGGSITGTVTAASSGDPVGRILVEALRVKGDGSTVPVASAATQADGTYQVSGLFPSQYLLRFSARGVIEPTYFPSASSLAQAKTITAESGKVTPGGDAVITGLPATITGKVDPGDTTDKVVTTVSARLLKQGPGQKVTIPPVKTKADGSYTIPNLPAPGNYELTFTTPGYQVSSVQTTVTGGAKRYQSTVVLAAGNAQISGTVTDGTDPLGGATVTTTVNGQQISTGTPTTGQIGQFIIGNLPTPATYVITVSKDGYGQVSQVIDLAPNKPQKGLTIALRSGTGVVDGRLVDQTGVGVGGATVTVGGLVDPPSTMTLTDRAVGTFHLTGLPTPGAYTLTFSVQGYADQTVPVTLAENTVLTPITVTMTRSVGSITGRVTGPTGTGLVNATVTATDGQHSWPVITTGNTANGTVGSYTIANLPQGIYTVTAADPSGGSQTSIVTVTTAGPVTLDFKLTGGG